MKKKRRDSGIGIEIRSLRKKKGLTQEDLAWMTGISKSHISKIERGECAPSGGVLRKIEDALNLEYMSLEKTKYSLVVNESIEQTVGEMKLDLLQRELSERGIMIVAYVTKAVADVIEDLNL